MNPKIKYALAIVALLVVSLWLFYPSDTNDAPQSDSLPVISRQDLLDATDVAAGVKQALVNQDQSAISHWLDKVAEVAVEAGLSDADIDYLRSDSAQRYVIFHAKRSLFNDALEQAYYQGMDIDALKAEYPEAQDLFARADQLIAKRNQLIQQIATELANGQTVSDAHLQAARQQWQQQMAGQPAP